MTELGFSPRIRRVAGVASVAALLTAAAACSSSGSSTPSSSMTTSPGSPPASAPATTTVNSGTATVNGAKTTVLTAPDGHTLYYFTPDTAGGQPTCTDTCAALWPPLTAANPTEASGVTGKLTVSTGAHAGQIIYNGHPLYEYQPDTAPGQAKGEGVMNEWHVATAALTAGVNPTAPAPSSPSSPGGGSGGY